MSYLIIKTVHIISIISWMAGLLYLPRLFVYHANSNVDSAESNTFKVMERRLLTAIMSPAMTIAWLSGLTLAIIGGWHTEIWFQIKLIFVIVLTVFHFYLSHFVSAYGQNQRPKSARFFRFINEVPTLLMIIIVAFVVIKPF